jgi:YfiH family protein
VENLDPHHPIHLALHRLVDGAHAPGPDLLEDLELTVQDVASDKRVLRSHGAADSGIMGRLPASSVSMVLLQSTLLVRAGFRHAFPERDSSDRALAAALQVTDARHIVQTKQVHAARTVEAFENPATAEADAIIARANGGAVAVGVRVADCVPVLVGDEASGDAAAIHAGWRGVVAGVVHSALQTLAGRALVVAIGPCIGPCCFEVSDDVAEAISHASNEGVIVRRPGEKPCVDLRAAVRVQLQLHGLSASRIDDVAGCTKHEVERFHSFRRDGKNSGRMLAAIASRRN